ncbi:MAG: 3-dehydroquinate synthase [Clostridia bacterium]|nr:3-dehydroquinate synthase [Clostridia bacterium]MDD3832119.1 3-dehydroquinate synthase [Clostridia bacterium]
MRLDINLAYSCELIIDNCLHTLGSYPSIRALAGKKALLITDNIVAPLYADTVSAQLCSCGVTVITHIVQSGENAKCVDNYLSIIDTLANNNFTREDIVVNLGGGTISDLGGFCASTYKRGIAYINIPTTLLAQIDAGIGGKTAINLPQGKNLLGVISNPQLILCDTSTLSTLPSNEWSNGMGELLKYCLLIGKPLLHLMSSWRINLSNIISICAEYKAGIVKEDFLDYNKRKLLNLGHTVAHAIERMSNYTTPHGLAVAQGVLLTVKYAYAVGKLTNADYDSLINMYTQLNMPHIDHLCADDIIDYCLNDKKASNGGLEIILINGIADCYIETVSWQQFHSILTQTLSK